MEKERFADNGSIFLDKNQLFFWSILLFSGNNGGGGVQHLAAGFTFQRSLAKSPPPFTVSLLLTNNNALLHLRLPPSKLYIFGAKALRRLLQSEPFKNFFLVFYYQKYQVTFQSILNY